MIKRSLPLSKLGILTSSILLASVGQTVSASESGQGESFAIDTITRNYVLTNDGYDGEFSEEGISSDVRKSVGFDAITSDNVDVYTVPLSYGMEIGLLGGDEYINFSADLPYVSIESPAGDESGIGDVRVGAEYFVEKEDIIFKGAFDLKLPMGDEDVGLGTGSTDYGFAVSGRKRDGDIGVNATAAYIIRGEGSPNGFDIDYGNVISLVGGGEYQIKPSLWLGANLAYVRSGTSESGGFESDGLQTIDLIPNAAYRLNTDMTVTVNIILPLSESIVDGDAPGSEPDRELSMSFGFNSEF